MKKLVITTTTIGLLVIAIVLLSFNHNKQYSLVGAWEIEQLKIVMYSYKGSDTSKTVIVNSSEWEKKMKTKNIRTFFNLDGTYHSLHKNLKDSVIYDPAGTWRTFGDSLIIQDTFPKKITYQYKYKLDKQLVEFWGVEDFDQDGKVDDVYYSKQKRVDLK